MTSRISHDASSVPIRTEGGGQTDQAQRSDLFVLDSVDGMSSVEELAMMLAMDEGEVLRILKNLSELKLVRWEETEARRVEDSEPEEATSQWRDEDSVITEEISSHEYEVEEDVAETFRFITAPATESVSQSSKKQPALPPKQDRDSKTARKTSRIGGPPPIPPSLPPPSKPSTTRREVEKTPRQHLDTSWWQSSGITQEPDELLTHREISNSGLRFALKTPPKEQSEQVTLTSRDDIVTDRINPVSGSIDVDESIADPEAIQQLSRPQISGEPAKSTSDEGETRSDRADTQPVVDEVAHTRDTEEPLLPDIEYDDKWSTKEKAAIPVQRKDSWKDEAITPALRADSGQWSADEARCISYFLRLIEHGSYYDIFGVEENADRETIAAAANSIEGSIDFYSLDLRGSNVGKDSLRRVQNGIQRALDVLQNSESRAQYDAALEALAAFKLS